MGLLIVADLRHLMQNDEDGKWRLFDVLAPFCSNWSAGVSYAVGVSYTQEIRSPFAVTQRERFWLCLAPHVAGKQEANNWQVWGSIL
jgi:hypothetical protein